jgi:hypothetical protein
MVYTNMLLSHMHIIMHITIMRIIDATEGTTLTTRGLNVREIKMSFNEHVDITNIV